MTTVSWVNGGWQGGWCWDGVVNELESAGHAALAPTLPVSSPEIETEADWASPSSLAQQLLR
jgi:hypothetical protein